MRAVCPHSVPWQEDVTGICGEGTCRLRRDGSGSGATPVPGPSDSTPGFFREGPLPSVDGALSSIPGHHLARLPFTLSQFGLWGAFIWTCGHCQSPLV